MPILFPPNHVDFFCTDRTFAEFLSVQPDGVQPSRNFYSAFCIVSTIPSITSEQIIIIITVRIVNESVRFLASGVPLSHSLPPLIIESNTPILKRICITIYILIATVRNTGPNNLLNQSIHFHCNPINLCA